MKKIRNKNAKPITILIILSALLALSGMAAIVSADESTPVTNIFRGNVAVAGEWVKSGTIITAYVDGEAEPRGSSTTDDYSWYLIDIPGDASVDVDKVIVFKVGDSVAEPTATWVASIQSQEHNLRVGALPDTPPPQPPADDDTSNGGGTSGGSGGSTTTTGIDTDTSTDESAAGDDATAPAITAETATTSPTEETPGTDDAEPEERSFPWFVVLVIAGLLVVAIIAYLAKKR